MPDDTKDNIIQFKGLTKLDLDPDTILQNAVGVLKEVLVLGTDKEGNQYMASSSGDGKAILWHLDTGHFALMHNIFYGDDEE